MCWRYVTFALLVAGGDCSINVYADGETGIEVPWEYIGDKPVVELTYSFPVGDATGITMNDTHAVIPLYKMMSAGFARNSYARGDSDWGVSTMVWGGNEITVMPNFMAPVLPGGPAAMIIEKIHTLGSSVDVVAERGASTATLSPEAMASLSSDIANYYASGDMSLQTQMWAALSHPDIVASVNEYALDRTKDVKARLARQEVSDLASLAARQLDEAKSGSAPVWSWNDCHHLAKGGPVSVTPQFLIVELNKNVNSIRGEISLAPFRSMGILSGVTIFSQAADGSLQLYMSSTSHGWLPTDQQLQYVVEPPTKLRTAAMFVGELGTEDDPRQQPNTACPGSSECAEAYRQMSAHPADFDYIFGDVSTLCPASLAEQIVQWNAAEPALQNPGSGSGLPAYVVA